MVLTGEKWLISAGCSVYRPNSESEHSFLNGEGMEPGLVSLLSSTALEADVSVLPSCLEEELWLEAAEPRQPLLCCL